MKLFGKIALITGASGVIGSTIARLYAKEGCEVVLCGRSLDSLNLVRDNLFKEVPGAMVHVFCVDIAVADEVCKALEILETTIPKLDILVTAAGVYGEIGTIEQCDPNKWMEATRVNLFGTMLAIKHSLPLLKKSKSGKIITFAGGGEGALPRFSPYVSSKGAVLRLTETLAIELAEEKITVNAISPGLVNSGLVKDLLKAGVERVGKDKYEAAQHEVEGIGGDVSPEKAANLALFLASDESNGITGKNISAVWDNWQEMPKHVEIFSKTDVYNWRRIKPKDRGYDW